MTTPALPRVFVTIPGVEDLDSIIDLLRASGAVITERRREFVIDGPLTPAQGTAAWWLFEHLDGNSDGNQLDLRIEPPSDLPSALAALCPDGYDGSGAWDSDPRTNDPSDPPRGGNHDWWMQQQELQREMLALQRAAVPAPVRQPGSPAAELACCGAGGAWAPAAGQPLALGCQLCPSAPTYWRDR